MDKELWKLENFEAFLAARRALLADAANQFFEELLHGETKWLAATETPVAVVEVLGGFSDDEEEEQLNELNGWVIDQGLSSGHVGYELIDPQSGAQTARIDLAWPDGVQEELSEPVAVLLNEGADLITLANAADFRCFNSIDAFKRYIRREILGSDSASELEALEAPVL